MLEVPSKVLLAPKPKDGKGRVVTNQSRWNLAGRKLLSINSKMRFNAFIIAVPGSETARTVAESRVSVSWDAFKKSVQLTYHTASFERVGHKVLSDFAQNPTAANQVMVEAKATHANFVMLFLEKASKPA